MSQTEGGKERMREEFVHGAERAWARALEARGGGEDCSRDIAKKRRKKRMSQAHWERCSLNLNRFLSLCVWVSVPCLGYFGR